MKVFPLISNILILLIFIGPLACSKGASKKSVIRKPVRTGGFLEPIPFKYSDFAPAISGDGATVVFVSGQDSTDESLSLKVMKSSWATGGSPGELSRLTTEDLGLERLVVLNTDGSTAYVVTTDSNQLNQIYRVNVGDGTSARLVADQIDVQSLALSGDGALLAWIARSSGVNQLFVIESAGGEPVALGADSRSVTGFAWTQANSGYALAMLVADTSTGGTMVFSRTFADLASASDAEPEEIMSAAGLAEVSSGGGTTVLIQANTDSEKTFSRIGNYADTDDANIFKTVIESEPVVMNDASSTTPYDNQAGDKATWLNVSSEGATLAYVARVPYRCEGQSDVFFGSFMALQTVADGAVEYLSTSVDAEGTRSGTDDLCSVADGALLDDKLVSTAMNIQATTDNFRMIGVTRFSRFKDENCRYKPGDQEVILFERTGGTDRWITLSNNPYPDLADSETEEPCP